MAFLLEEQGVSIRVAEENDLKKVLDLLVNAAEWLKTKGTTQWDYYLTDLEGNSDEINESIKRRNTYLFEKEGESVASITLEDKPGEWDMDIWGGEAAQENVIYLHRILVNRNYAGLEIGDALMEWAKKNARQHGKSSIRFDCLNSNKGLNHYYQRHYALKGISEIYGKHSKYEIIL
jgi:GNAT superfamily N-acetyltransferase